MEISREKQYVLIKSEKETIVDFASTLTRKHKDFVEENIVIDLANHKEVATRDLLSFLEMSNLHRAEAKSFVIVNATVSIDELPEELIVVPSLQEAKDLIEMEEIQRDLGFDA